MHFRFEWSSSRQNFQLAISYRSEHYLMMKFCHIKGEQIYFEWRERQECRILLDATRQRYLSKRKNNVQIQIFQNCLKCGLAGAVEYADS
jgi:hypothetical protein